MYHFRLSTSAPAIDPLRIPPQGPHYFSQPCFLDETTLVAVGHHLTADGHLLSVRWCHNRPISVWKLKLEGPSTSSEAVVIGDTTQISCKGQSGRSPCIYRDKDDGDPIIVWLEHQLGGPHASCSRLVRESPTADGPSTLVPFVPEASESGAFPGLFINWALLPRPFLRIDDRVHVVCTTMHGTRSTIMLADTEKSEQTPLDLAPKDENLWSYSVLATDGKARLLCSRSSLVCPSQLVLGRLDTLDKPVEWQVLWQPPTPPYS
jgi:hypothetical protein